MFGLGNKYSLKRDQANGLVIIEEKTGKPISVDDWAIEIVKEIDAYLISTLKIPKPGERHKELVAVHQEVLRVQLLVMFTAITTDFKTMAVLQEDLRTVSKDLVAFHKKVLKIANKRRDDRRAKR